MSNTKKKSLEPVFGAPDNFVLESKEMFSKKYIYIHCDFTVTSGKYDFSSKHANYTILSTMKVQQ